MFRRFLSSEGIPEFYFCFACRVTLVGAAIQPVQMGLLDRCETIISFVYVYMKQSYIYVFIFQVYYQRSLSVRPLVSYLRSLSVRPLASDLNGGRESVRERET